MRAAWAAVFLMDIGVCPLPPFCVAEEPTAPQADAPAAPPTLEAVLAELHGKARQARTDRRFAEVEALRVERLKTLLANEDADAKSPWVAGAKAIATADSQIKAMHYEQACATLTEAWKAFETTPRGEPVFGDIALKLFEASEAAKAVYPDFNAVSADHLRNCLRLAAEADPCQVEALVANAFLAPPDPAEAFQPAENRPSLKSRNKHLRDISYVADRDAQPLPWHAPVELLEAGGNGFVLGDLDYYHRFLDPARRLQGTDRNGEPVHVVMAGCLLTVARDDEGRKRPVVIDFDADRGRWMRMTPRILRVQPPAYKPETWRIDAAQLNADLRSIMDAAIAERQTLLKRRLLVTAEGLQGAIRVKADIRKILVFMQEPPKSQEPLKLEQVFQMVQAGYGNYVRVHPDEATKIDTANRQVQQLADEWMQFTTRVEALRAAIGNLGGGSRVEPERAATALADFLKEIGMEYADTRDLADDEDEQAARDEGARKTAKKSAPKKLDATGPIQLSGQELRLKMSRQKDQYDLLALFKLMRGMHRQAIEATLASTPPPAPGAVGSPPSREERARTAARDRLADSLARYDRLLPDSADPTAPGDFSLTLDELLAVGSATRQMAAALRSLGSESEQTRFLARFADTIDAVARPAAYEADMQRYCTKTNRAKSWQVGRATWRVYDFPAGTAPEKLADMIDHCQRVAFTLADFDAAMAQAVDDLPPADVDVMLRPGCTTPLRNRLVHDRNGKLALQFLSTLTEPCTVLFLDVDASETSGGSPAFIAEGDGPPLWLEIDGQRLRTAIAGTKKRPDLVVDFLGPQGRVPLGARSEAFADVRVMTDRRGNRIVRDRAKITSPLEAHFYAMTTKAGDPMTERAVNYVIQDWMDLDHTIINRFLPNVMLYAPSLPAWQTYRREFMRPAPDVGWMWPPAQRAVTPGQ